MALFLSLKNGPFALVGQGNGASLGSLFSFLYHTLTDLLGKRCIWESWNLETYRLIFRSVKAQNERKLFHLSGRFLFAFSHSLIIAFFFWGGALSTQKKSIGSQ